MFSFYRIGATNILIYNTKCTHFYYFCENFHTKTMAQLFTKRDIRALALLLPLLVVLVWVVVEALNSGPSKHSDTPASEDVFAQTDSIQQALSLSPFDPNTVTYEELREMNVDKFVARNIVKYRSTGRTFSIPEDVAIVYGISDSLYAQLKPYIRIGAKYLPQPKTYTSDTLTGERFTRKSSAFKRIPFDPTTLDAEGFYGLGCFTARQAEAMVEYRQRLGGFRSLLEFADCYLISDTLYAAMEEFITLSPIPEPEKVLVDINSADSTTLVALPGIGPASAVDSILYRERLGGYHSTEQLKDLAVIMDKNYDRFVKEIWCDSCKIQKIDINFVAPKELARHPYMTATRMRKILKQRQKRGGWSTIEEMVKDKIFTEEEAARISPYLQFNPVEK